MKSPTYGTSTHYDGDSGDRYFDWQDEHGALRGRINARKFCDYIQQRDVVLDFGCGGGHLLKALTCQSRVGVDVNPNALESARSLGIECFADIANVPDRTADVAISNHALEHVPYPIEALRQIRRALKPSGRLLLYVPIDDWRTQKAWDPQDINHHLNTWSPLLLGNTLDEAGFDVAGGTLSVVTHAWPPRWHKLYARSPAGFDALATFWSVARRRRQIFADVIPKDSRGSQASETSGT